MPLRTLAGSQFLRPLAHSSALPSHTSHTSATASLSVNGDAVWVSPAPCPQPAAAAAGAAAAARAPSLHPSPSPGTQQLGWAPCCSPPRSAVVELPLLAQRPAIVSAHRRRVSEHAFRIAGSMQSLQAQAVLQQSVSCVRGRRACMAASSRLTLKEAARKKRPHGTQPSTAMLNAPRLHSSGRLSAHSSWLTASQEHVTSLLVLGSRRA